MSIHHTVGPEVYNTPEYLREHQLRSRLLNDRRVSAVLIDASKCVRVGLEGGRGLSPVKYAGVSKFALRQQLRLIVTLPGNGTFGLVAAEIGSYPMAYLPYLPNNGRPPHVDERSVLVDGQNIVFQADTVAGRAETRMAISDDGQEIAVDHRGPGCVELLGTDVPDFQRSDLISPAAWMVAPEAVGQAFAESYRAVHKQTAVGTAVCGSQLQVTS